MRLTSLLSAIAAFAALPTVAVGVTIEIVPVANPGNSADFTGYGAVAYNYRIGKYEVTSAQYAEFLNAKAASDPLGLYDPYMEFYSGLVRSGTSGSYTYAAMAGYENKPISHVNWFDTVRFANWLNNGQANGDTETGAYTLGELDEHGIPIDGSAITRNRGATWFLPTEDEWYKAAYHKNDGATGNYFETPNSTNTLPTCDDPPGGINSANICFSIDGYLTDVAAYVQSHSPYGTFGQAGNVSEWTQYLVAGQFGRLRGASFVEGNSRSWLWENREATIGTVDSGFRVATVPEPSSLTLAALGLVGCLTWVGRRARRR